MVADDDSRRKLLLLDQELLNDDSVETFGGEKHTVSTNGQGSKYSTFGCGRTENSKTNNHHTDLFRTGIEVSNVLAVALQTESERRGTKTKDNLRTNTVTGRRFNPDPKVADYENAQEVFEYFLGYADTK